MPGGQNWDRASVTLDTNLLVANSACHVARHVLQVPTIVSRVRRVKTESLLTQKLRLSASFCAAHCNATIGDGNLDIQHVRYRKMRDYKRYSLYSLHSMPTWPVRHTVLWYSFKQRP